MRKPEQKFWDRMRKHKPQTARLERIENAVSVGIPDVLVISNGQVTWCELKFVDKFPARLSTRVLGAKGLNIAQANWHYEWHAMGGCSIVLVGVGVDKIYAIPGLFADSINMMHKADLEKYSVAQDWESLFNFFGEKQ